ncbi:MAG: hypothetical protein ACI4L2_00215 [Wujia sp.]
MYKVINQYMSKIFLQSGEEVRKWLCEQVKTVKTIKSFSVAERAKQFVIDMKLEAFSVEEAARVFHEIHGKLANPYSSIYVRYNEGKCVRYRFITCRENKEGIYCDFVFS